MRFVAAHYTEVATWLSTLWTAVSLAAQSMLGLLLDEVFQVDIVGEMVAKLLEQAEQCLHLEDLRPYPWANR
jgi:hypothetical protein